MATDKPIVDAEEIVPEADAEELEPETTVEPLGTPEVETEGEKQAAILTDDLHPVILGSE